MRIKTLAIAALCPLRPRRAGVGRCRDPDRVGLGRRAAGAARPSSPPTRRRSTRRSTSSTPPTAATPASRTSRTGPASSPARPARRSPATPGRPTSRCILDGLCIDVNPKNKLTNITIQQLHDIYRGLLTNWSQVPAPASTTTIDPVGRDTNGGTYNFFLQAVLNNEPPASNVNALTVRRPRRQRGQAGPERDRLRRPRLAGKGLKTLKVNGVPCAPSKISVEPLKYPLSRYIFLVLPARQPEPGGDQVHRLGAAQQAGRRSHQQGRRRPRRSTRSQRSK